MKAILSILLGSIVLFQKSSKGRHLMILGGYNAFTSLITGVLGLTAVLINSIHNLEVSFVHVAVNVNCIMIHVMHLHLSSSI